MFASKYPALFILQFVIIGLILGGTCIAGMVLSQPLLFPLAIFGLNMFPSFPIVSASEEGPGESGVYDGGGNFGFSTRD